MKKRLELHFLPVAEEDITEIVDFIAQDNISAASRFYDGLEKKFIQLTLQPYIGIRRSEPELKSAGYFSLVHGNYLIFYTIEYNAVVIHRVINGYRDYLKLLK